MFFKKPFKKKRSHLQSNLMIICMIILVSSSVFECTESQFILDKLLAYEPKGKIYNSKNESLIKFFYFFQEYQPRQFKRAHTNFKKNLEDCETVEECREIFRMIVKEYSVGKKSDSVKLLDQPRKSFFKWG